MKIFYISVVALTIVLAGCGISASSSGEATKQVVEKLERARSLEATDKNGATKITAEAFELIGQIETGDPNNSKNFFLIGRELLNSSYIDRAEKMLKKGITIFSKANLKGQDSTATWQGLHYNLYTLYRAKNDLKSALEIIGPVKGAYPQVVIQSRMEYGYALYDKGQYNEAIEQFENGSKESYNAIRKFPMFDLSSQSENFAFYGGESYKKLKMGDDKVLAIYRMAAESYPENYNILSRYYKELQSQKKFDGVMEEYKSSKDPIIMKLTEQLAKEKESDKGDKKGGKKIKGGAKASKKSKKK